MYLIFMGTGYVGLVSGVMMTSQGHHVICFDKDEAKINNIKEGKLPIYEPELDEYIKAGREKKRLKFASNYSDVDFHPDAVFICVGTPAKESGEANLDYVYEAALDSAKNFRDAPIIIKSTVPPGTCALVEDKLKEAGYKNKVISNPEFLAEGRAVKDFLNPDRIVVGVDDRETKYLMEMIYESFQENVPIFYCSRISSELIKYASNTFLATKIAFINEMANLCEKIGADINQIAVGMGFDKRIGKDFLQTGPGFGGSCFPKDILALQSVSRKYGAECKVLEATIESNKKRSFDIVQKIKEKMGGLSGRLLAIYGLTYKADTDDIRSSPAIEVVKLLAEEGAYICAYDPKGMKNAKPHLSVDMARDYLSCAMGANAVIILTEWEEFRNIDYKKLSEDMGDKIIFDYRNMLSPHEAEEFGFKVYQLGKPE